MTEKTEPDAEMSRVTITETRQFEIDLSEEQLNGIMEDTSQVNQERAIEEKFLGSLVSQTSPEEKLIGADVDAAVE